MTAAEEVVFCSVSMAWRIARSARTVASIGWASSADARRVGGISWGESGRTDGARYLAWGMPPNLNAQTGCRWGTISGTAGGSAEFAWTAIPRVSNSLSLPWPGGMRCAARTTKLKWWHGMLRRGHRRLTWQGLQERTAMSRVAGWRSPELTHRCNRMPWGPAKPLPWAIRPPPTPDPDPEPRPGIPPGNAIPLSLACALVQVPGLAPLNLGVSV